MSRNTITALIYHCHKCFVLFANVWSQQILSATLLSNYAATIYRQYFIPQEKL
jgi:hypothetical protein